MTAPEKPMNENHLDKAERCLNERTPLHTLAIRELIEHLRSAPSPVAAPPEVSGGTQRKEPHARCRYHATHGDRLLRCVLPLGHDGDHDCYPPEVKPPPDAGGPSDRDLLSAFGLPAKATGEGTATLSKTETVGGGKCEHCDGSGETREHVPGTMGMRRHGKCHACHGSGARPSPETSDDKPSCWSCGACLAPHEWRCFRCNSVQADKPPTLSKSETVGGGKCANCDGQGRIVCSWCSGRGSGARPSPETSECAHEVVGGNDCRYCRKCGVDIPEEATKGACPMKDAEMTSVYAKASDEVQERGGSDDESHRAGLRAIIANASPPVPEPSTEDERIVDALVARRTAGARETRLVPETVGDGESDEANAGRAYEHARERDGDKLSSPRAELDPKFRVVWIDFYRFVRAESDATVKASRERVRLALGLPEDEPTLMGCKRIVELLASLTSANADLEQENRELDALSRRAREYSEKLDALDSAHTELVAKLAAAEMQIGAWSGLVETAILWRSSRSADPRALGRLSRSLVEAVDAIPEGLRPGREGES